MFVEAVLRFSRPKLKILLASSTEVISSSTAPGMTTIPWAFSFMSRFTRSFFFVRNKSDKFSK